MAPDPSAVGSAPAAAGAAPPTTRGPSWLLLAVVCVGQFMVVLDGTMTLVTTV